MLLHEYQGLFSICAGAKVRLRFGIGGDKFKVAPSLSSPSDFTSYSKHCPQGDAADRVSIQPPPDSIFCNPPLTSLMLNLSYNC